MGFDPLRRVIAAHRLGHDVPFQRSLPAPAAGARHTDPEASRSAMAGGPAATAATTVQCAARALSEARAERCRMKLPPAASERARWVGVSSMSTSPGRQWRRLSTPGR